MLQQMKYFIYFMINATILNYEFLINNKMYYALIHRLTILL